MVWYRFLLSCCRGCKISSSAGLSVEHREPLPVMGSAGVTNTIKADARINESISGHTWSEPEQGCVLVP